MRPMWNYASGEHIGTMHYFPPPRSDSAVLTTVSDRAEQSPVPGPANAFLGC